MKDEWRGNQMPTSCPCAQTHTYAQTNTQFKFLDIIKALKNFNMIWTKKNKLQNGMNKKDFHTKKWG